MFTNLWRMIVFGFQNFFRNIWLSLITVLIVVLNLFLISLVSGLDVVGQQTLTAVTWSAPDGRVIDLSYAAYSALKTKNKGVTQVEVYPVGSRVSKTSNNNTGTVALKAESVPDLKTVKVSDTSLPSVSAKAYIVIDQNTGAVLAEKNSSTAYPIASITKLMTAMVWLDTNPSFKEVITYQKSDITPYAYLRVNPGEKMTTGDLFYSMLVGSANNASTALARSTGLTWTQFIARMNAKAASWGLTHTKFADTSGLNAKNVSSASDLAIIASHAFHDYPAIRAATTLKSYSFTTINTKKYHNIKTTDLLVLNGSSLSITGGKTGYIDEAAYTYILRTKNSQGAQVITVVLGCPTATLRYNAAVSLSKWAWLAYNWT